jgi:hypothetical protein
MVLRSDPLSNSSRHPISYVGGDGQIASDIWRARGFFAKPRPGCSRFLVACSILYAASMVLRYALTMTYRPEMRWFGDTIPIFFHFVLAAFVYTWGKFHSKRDILAIAPYTTVPQSHSTSM